MRVSFSSNHHQNKIEWPRIKSLKKEKNSHTAEYLGKPQKHIHLEGGILCRDYKLFYFRNSMT